VHFFNAHCGTSHSFSAGIRHGNHRAWQFIPRRLHDEKKFLIESNSGTVGHDARHTFKRSAGAHHICLLGSIPIIGDEPAIVHSVDADERMRAAGISHRRCNERGAF